MLHDIGGLVPAQALFVDEQAHHFGNGQAGVGIVDMDGHLFRQQRKIIAEAAFKILQRVLQRGAGEEIMLLQPQLLALQMVILGIEHLADNGGQLLFLHGLGIIAAVEGGKIQRLGGMGAPHAQRVHRFAVVARHRHIIGHGLHGVVILQGEDSAAVYFAFLHIAAVMHLAGILHGREFPHVAVFQPVIGHLDLLPFQNALAEKAVFIANGAAHGGQGKGGQAVHKAGGQAAQAAVAQAGLRLLPADFAPIQP